MQAYSLTLSLETLKVFLREDRFDSAIEEAHPANKLNDVQLFVQELSGLIEDASFTSRTETLANFQESRRTASLQKLNKSVLLMGLEMTFWTGLIQVCTY